MRKDYKIDFASQTITITAAFEQAMSNPKSDAYKTIRKLHQQAGRCIRLQSL